MKWTGKVFGGVLGMLAGGPWGAALGVALGHQFDDPQGRGPQPGERADGYGSADPLDGVAVSERYFQTTFEVMGHVAKADGRISHEEIRAARAVMNDFHLDAAQVQAAIAHFTRGKDGAFDVTAAVRNLRRACAGRPDLLRIFLEIQVRTSIAGCDMRGPARSVLENVGVLLGVGPMEFAHMEAILRLRRDRYGSDEAGAGPGRSANSPAGSAGVSLNEAYEILEISAAASDDEVIKSYRRQLSRHHPDKLKANGLPESMLEHAKQRTQQIIEAWDVIRSARGLH